MRNAFQFHKGTIKTRQPSEVRASPRDFNSIKVRLKLDTLGRMLTCYDHFNSIKVRLNPPDRREGGLQLAPLNFNSIKVRLKHDWKKWSDAVNAFQFHKGTIKTQSAIRS